MGASEDVTRFLLLLHSRESEDEEELQAFVEGDDFVNVGFEGVECVEEDVESRLKDAKKILRRLEGEAASNVDKGCDTKKTPRLCLMVGILWGMDRCHYGIRRGWC